MDKLKAKWAAADKKTRVAVVFVVLVVLAALANAGAS